MAYQIAQTPVTLNDLEVHSSVSGLFKCKSSTFVQRSNLQDFNWHARVARPSATAGLLVGIYTPLNISGTA